MAHELGHTKEYTFTNNSSLLFASRSFIPLITSFSCQAIAIFWDAFSKDKTSYHSTYVEVVLMIALTLMLKKTFLHRRENYADNVARELAGPLSLASATRKSHQAHYYRQSASFLNRWPGSLVIAALHQTGLNDVFSAHPDPTKRM